MKSRSSGAFVHSIASVESTEKLERGVSLENPLQPISVVSNAIVPIFREALATTMDASRYSIV